MSQENVEKGRRALEAFIQGDLDAHVADMDPDFEYITSGALPDRQGVFRGVEEYKRFIRWGSGVEVDMRVYNVWTSGATAIEPRPSKPPLSE